MSKNIFDTIKDQIDAQTRPHLNVDLNKQKVLGVGSRKDNPVVDNVVHVNPIWLKGKYNLIRRYLPESIQDFLNISSSVPIEWETLTSNGVWFYNLDPGDNVLVGTNVLLDSGVSSIRLSHTTLGLFTQILVQPERLETTDEWIQYNLVGRVTTPVSDPYFDIPIQEAGWHKIVLVGLAHHEGSLGIALDTRDIIESKEIHTTVLPTPTWASSPLTRVPLEDGSIISKIQLSWEKDTNPQIDGTSIYKKQKVDSGYTVANHVPSTLIQNIKNTDDIGNDTWLCYFGTIATVNAGDLVSFGDSTGTFKLSDVIKKKPSLNSNPYFTNDSSYWSLTSGTIKSGPLGLIGEKYYNLDTFATNTKVSLTSATIDIDLTKRYTVFISTDNDFCYSRPYGLGGYGITPSRWDTAGSITSVEATRSDYVPLISVVRNGIGTIRMKGAPIYLTASASYYLYAAASIGLGQKFDVNLYKKINGSLAYAAPSLVGENFHGFLHRFTPSITGTSYLEFTVYGTTPTASAATLQIKQPKIFTYAENSNDFSEYFRVYYYKSDESACATPFVSIPLPRSAIPFGYAYSYDTIASSYIRLPSTCSFLKVGYVATINATDTLYAINRNVYMVNCKEPENAYESYLTNIFATQAVWVRGVSTLSYILGSIINLHQFDRVHDRPRQGDDGSYITWEDFNVTDNTTVEYYLDHYGSSLLKNRSIRTVAATIFVGDLTSPKASSNYSLEGLTGGIKHTWTNPTATDLKGVRCYSDLSLTNVVFNLYGSSSATMSYTELVTGTALATRWLVAYDASNNVSPSAMATCIPLAANITDLGFGIVVKDDSNNELVPNNNGWYNQNVNASILYEGNSAIASYYYQISQDGGNWSSWINFNGSLAFGADAKWKARFKINDTQGNESSPSETIIINRDTAGPIWGSNKYKYWDGAISQGYPGLNKLKWDNQYVSDDLSDVYKTHIKRGQVNVLNSNPLFRHGTVDVGPEGFTFYNLGWFYCELSNSESYNEDNSVRFRCTASQNEQANFTSNTELTLDNGETIHLFARYKEGTIDTNFDNVGLALYHPQSSAIVQAATVTLYAANTGTSYWRYIHLDYTNSGASTIYQARWAINATVIGGDVIYLDEFVSFKTSLSTIAVVDAKTNGFYDDDVEPWKGYVYNNIVEDSAGNFSTLSDYKFASPVQNYKDKFRNLVKNSSFERTYRDTSNVLLPEDWEFKTLYGQFGYVEKEYGQEPIVSDGNSYHGQNYLKGFTSLTEATLLAQNNIHVLPYAGRNRNFIFSAYVKDTDDDAVESTGVLYLYAYSSERTLVKSKSISATANYGNDWKRVVATFLVSVPSITNFSIFMGAGSSEPIAWDAIQLEEKESLPPTDYYDADVITVDHLQGALVRSHMIESEQIYGGHIKADTITATQINADTITTNELNLANIDLILKIDEKNTQLFGVGGGENVFPTVYIRQLTFATINEESQHGAGGYGYGYGFYVAADYYAPSGAATYFPADRGMVLGYIDRWNNEMQPYWCGPATNLKNYSVFNYAETYPFSSAGTAVISMYKTNAPNQYYYYTCYATFNSSRNRFPLDSTYWSAPTLICSKEIYRSGLKYAAGNFHDILWAANGTNIILTRLDHQGQNPTLTYKTSPSLGAVSYDMTSNGTMMVVYSHYGGQSTFWVVGYSSDTHAIVMPTIALKTYSGLASIYNNELEFKDVVSNYQIRINCIVDNKFFVNYDLGHNKSYYKIIDLNGNILVGQGGDLLWRGESVMSGTSGIVRSNFVKTPFNHSIVWSTPGNDSNNGAYLDTFYIQKTSATISLEDLFNRMT